MASTGKLDGYPVELYDGAFAGKFEMTEEDGKRIGYDDVVSFLVVATADKANFDTTKGGEVRRTNRLTVNEVMVLENSVARDLMASAGRLELDAEQMQLPAETIEDMIELEVIDSALDTIEDYEEVFSPGGMLVEEPSTIHVSADRSGAVPEAPSPAILKRFLDVV